MIVFSSVQNLEQITIMVWRVAMREPKQYRRWQVIVGFVMFMALMGLVGKEDYDSKQALLDEKVNVRDSLQVAVEGDVNIWTAHYINRSRDGR
jgi:hypothetical protein